METFYATMAQVCFAALGLWWVVVQFKYDRWSASPGRRAMAGAVSGQFIAVGLLALVAILSAEVPTLWRVGSFIGGGLGLIATAIGLSRGSDAPAQRTLGVIQIILFALLIPVSLPAVNMQELVGLKSILVEALIDCLVLGVSVWQAWLCMMEGELRVES
jgi:hypothetical protein